MFCDAVTVVGVVAFYERHHLWVWGNRKSELKCENEPFLKCERPHYATRPALARTIRHAVSSDDSPLL